MKINIILPAIGHSGGIDVVYKYVEILTLWGHNIIVYKQIKAPNMHRYNSQLKNYVHQIYCSLKAVKAANKKIYKYDRFVFEINNNSIREADVIIATSWPTTFKVNKLANSKGKKYYFIQDYEIWDNKIYGIKSYEFPLNKIVISSWINKKLKEELDIGPFPIVLNGLDLKKYHNNNKIYKMPGASFQFLMLNHRLKKKGIQNGIEVFERIKQRYPNSKLKMFGMCPRGNLPEYIDYIQNPSQDLIVKMYSTSDIFIFPSLEEGWGLTPLEAMACECAVVATRTGFVLDLGKHEDNMMISNPGDIEDMVNNIEKLINDTKLLKKISCNGKKTANQLNWEDSCEKLLKILKNYNVE